MENLDKNDCEAKERLFYSAMLSAWLNTRLELDKQLLGLSVTAIGLLVTLLRTLGVSNFSQIVLFGFALFAYLTTVISVIYILHENSEHIEKLLNSSEAEESQFLAVLDTVAGISFVIGMMLTVTIGIHSAVINLSEKGAIVSQEQPKNFSIQTDSWNGVNKLRPQPPKKDSNDTTNESKPSKTSEGFDDSKSNN
ncbi:MAG: hypothetical protein KME11_02040 [Timaviella obliquedivisa GSE-PSE-MK23-08B]|jgi:hypothetical protein|nr:hypothetical protein [Timaviella obliquedivisa GSE-PSE-MK23-08B]